MEENFSPQQSLQVIQSMIEKAKNQFSENGFLYLLWGWLILFCSLGEFILIKIGYHQHYQIWFLAWAATIYQFFYIAKKRRKAKVRTYTDTIIGFVWFTFFIVLMLMIFMIANSSDANYYKLFGPVLIVL